MPPQGESRAPARAPAWSHSGSGRGGIPTARNPPRGETQGPGFFSFFDFFDFFVFWPFRKKSKNIKKNEKNPGCPRRESQGLQPGLQPGATQDPGEEGFPRPETPHAGRPRVPDFFPFFCFFFLFFGLFEKNQKNPGCPRRESQGLQPGLQPGATQDPGEEGFPRPETPHAGRPRVPDFSIFLIFFDFFRFLAFSKKIKKI